MTISGVLSSSPIQKRSNAPFTILVVEDSPTDVEIMLRALEHADIKPLDGDFDMEVRANAEGALQLLSERSVDLVLTDMVLPRLSGLDLVSRIQNIDSNLPVLVVTRVNEVSQAVEAMRRGAFDYVLKPVNSDDLGMRLHRAIRMSEIMRRHAVYENEFRQDYEEHNLVGSSGSFERVLRGIREAAQTRSNVLITGETGTGKGLIARAIHQQSSEQQKVFQVIDCTTVPEGMMESELFGHVRGAFTGAISNKPGLIELANGGTVFFDEIGELPLPLQAKLLRVLEDNEVRPVGGTRVRKVDMRFIAATNRDLEAKVREGSFRQDLYYRLAVIKIAVPPLRERREDIPLIARHLLAKLSSELGKPRCYFDENALRLLQDYTWPGNARELRNVIERAIMIATDDTITEDVLQALLPVTDNKATRNALEGYVRLPYAEAKDHLLGDFTKKYLQAKLIQYDRVISKAAESSGITRQHFSFLMKRYLGEGVPDE